ncbi:MAG: tRNA-binding protein [Brumimicrobium sp.]|nr:tRNA-binding protein [Brumimicrobium sp.]
MKNGKKLTAEEFSSVDMRAGTVIGAEFFKEARKPAIKLQIDFGEELGILKSSAQICDLYSPEDLIGNQIVAVINFPPKQIANMMSECLVLGIPEQRGVTLLHPGRKVANGSKIM